MQNIRAWMKRRSGMALPTALAGIVVIGVMVSGVFYMSTQELRSSTGGIAHERAFRAAEYGINQVVGEWDNIAMGLQTVGTRTTKSFSGTGWVDTVRITKVGGFHYALVSTGTVNAGVLGTARRTTSLSLRTVALNFNFNSALTVRGDAKIGGSSLISGNDWIPTTWNDCPAAGSPKAGLAVQSSQSIQLSGCQGTAQEPMPCLQGSPKIIVTSDAADTTKYFTFGDLQWAELTSMATRVYTGSPTMNAMAPRLTAAGACDYSHTLNWGEPWHTNPAHMCESHFPIIHFKGPGTVNLSGGRGQGILLVDGDLEVSGGFEFYGPVIVRGTLKAVGQSGSKLNGAVMAANIEVSQSTVLGDATVRYSACVIDRAKQAAASPRRLAQRAWVESY